jgi:multiple RNA-binding domain-containing protein 1
MMVDQAGDASLPRPWSRYSEGSSRHTKTHPDQKDTSASASATTTTATTTATTVNPKDKKKLLDDKKEQLLRFLYADEKDDKLKEFLQVMRPRAAAKGQTWANDDGLPMVTKKGESSQTSDVKGRADGVNNEEDDEYQDLPVLKEQPTGINPETLLDDEELLEKEEDIPEQPQDSVAFDSAISDLDYLRSKMKVVRVFVKRP